MSRSKVKKIRKEHSRDTNNNNNKAHVIMDVCSREEMVKFKKGAEKTIEISYSQNRFCACQILILCN